MVKRGFKINRQAVVEQDEGNLSLLRFEIESKQGLTGEDVAFLEAEIPGVVAVLENSAADTDVKALLDRYGPQLIGRFPGIRDTLQKCAAELPASSKPEVLTRLGRGLGRWQYAQNYALGGLLSLEKTLQRMLWPSLEDFLDIETSGNRVEVRNCPVCASHDVGASDCHFVAGYIAGFLGELAHLPATSVIQSAAAAGSAHCSFEVRGNAG